MLLGTWALSDLSQHWKCFTLVPYISVLWKQTLAYIVLQTVWTLFPYGFNHYVYVSGVVKSYFMLLWDLPFLSYGCFCHRNIFPHDCDMLLFFLTKWAFSKTSFVFPVFRWILLWQFVHKKIIICLPFWLLMRLLVVLRFTLFII